MPTATAPGPDCSEPCIETVGEGRESVAGRVVGGTANSRSKSLPITRARARSSSDWTECEEVIDEEGSSEEEEVSCFDSRAWTDQTGAEEGRGMAESALARGATDAAATRPPRFTPSCSGED